MKMPSTSIALKAVMLSLVASISLSAIAQSVIQRAAEPYAAKPEIQFVVIAASSIVESSAPTPPLVPAASFEIKKGKRVDEQLRAYGSRSGWDLVWQAPEYVLDQNMTIQGDFESSVLFFLNGANEAGARLRAVFYRGNKTVRVTEF